MIGTEIYFVAKQLWFINRSLTGDIVRKIIAYIKEHFPTLII